MGAVCLLGCLSLPATAQDGAQNAAPVTAETASMTSGQAAAAFDAEAETRRLLATHTGEARARSDAYFEGGHWVNLWGTLWALAVAWLLLGTRLSARIRTWLEARTRRRWLQNLGYIPVYLVLAAVLTLPWTLYTGFVREHQYGLSTQTIGAWLRDFSVGQAVTIVMFTPALLLLYIAIRKFPRRWWLLGAGGGVAFMAFFAFVSPVFIQPLFNTYTPLQDGPVREAVLSMAHANGVPANNVYVVDASRQTTRISANVSGLGSTIRISLNDNLLNQGTPAEIKAVMGHEIGHYVLGHSTFHLLCFGLLFVAGFAFVHYGVRGVIARHGPRWGVRGLDDIASLPAIMAALSLFFLIATPVTNNIIRTAETQADIFGLNAAREPDGFASSALKLSTYRKIEPSRFEEFFFYTHPSGASRIGMAMRWKAENLDTPPPATNTTAMQAEAGNGTETGMP